MNSNAGDSGMPLDRSSGFDFVPDEVHRSHNVHAPVVQLECENSLTAEYAAKRKVYLIYHAPLLINPMVLRDIHLFCKSFESRIVLARGNTMIEKSRSV